MLNWLATGCFLVAGSTLAMKIQPLEKYAFVFFLIGHFLCLINSIIKDINSLKIRYIFFCIIDGIGIYNWFWV